MYTQAFRPPLDGLGAGVMNLFVVVLVLSLREWRK
jgi:hypothetical protein